MRCGTSTGRGFVKDVAQLVRGMILSGAAHRKCGGTGAGEERVDLLTFHHRRAVPSGAVQIRFQSKGFSLEERAATGKAFGAPASQGTKSCARMPTAVQPSGTGSASCSGTSQPVRRTACESEAKRS